MEKHVRIQYQTLLFGCSWQRSQSKGSDLLEWPSAFNVYNKWSIRILNELEKSYMFVVPTSCVRCLWLNQYRFIIYKLSYTGISWKFYENSDVFIVENPFQNIIGLQAYSSYYTGDPLHNRAACTQPCNVNTHSRAPCSPGARLCEQWGHGCVNNGARLCASARLCRGSPVITRSNTIR